MVPVTEVLREGPLGDVEIDEEHTPPGSVTVTVAVAMLTVDNTVVVAQEVTVDAGHCELVGDKVSEPVAVPLGSLEVGESDVDDDGPGPPEDVGEPVVDVPVCSRPHSSKL